ncbi:MAG: hemerythrin domain-containing protein [Deltaproteobacteria bacterium]|jgi:hemerythrin-like domain-containing protein|nr:hemerythrin domain-containing protein [Deltaproteobacteria bacterium]MCL5880753.1 hemerythrin domain-containing protein [Deltaproteobacteria bacterium]MDA8304219.1 hemerythrin domain-containing protein [Deltaproteobacteria bacterium]
MDTNLDPIMSLRSDHEIVRGVLNNLSGYLKKIGGDSSDNLRKNLINQLNEITAFIDKDLEIHFKKEEEALFPVLGNYIGLETGPIHVMLIEHKHSRELSEDFKTSIKDYQTSGNYKAVVSAGNSFASLLSEHIDKEDHILFNMADMHLTATEKESIMEKMRTIK